MILEDVSVIFMDDVIFRSFFVVDFLGVLCFFNFNIFFIIIYFLVNQRKDIVENNFIYVYIFLMNKIKIEKLKFNYIVYI